jgi:hypothetical protein
VEALWRLRRLANGGIDLDGLRDQAVAELATPFCKHRASAAMRHHKHRAESASTSGGFVASGAFGDAGSYIDTLMFTGSLVAPMGRAYIFDGDAVLHLRLPATGRRSRRAVPDATSHHGRGAVKTLFHGLDCDKTLYFCGFKGG